MDCETYSEILVSAVAIIGICAMVIMVYIVYKKNKAKRELLYNFITWYNSKPRIKKPKDGLITISIIEKYLNK